MPNAQAGVTVFKRLYELYGERPMVSIRALALGKLVHSGKAQKPWQARWRETLARSCREAVDLAPV